jgi:glutamine---fructose-6-phosphate transaminase (isomerizing)
VARPSNEPLPGAPEPWVPSEIPRFRSRPPYLMTEMIAIEPALAQRLVRRLSKAEAMESLATAVNDAASSGRTILTTGCGTSEHAAMGIAELLTEALDPEAGRETRSAQALEHLRRPLADGLLIAVSHEGGTHATNEALRAARDAGARTALISVSDRSPGAELADIVVTTEEQDQSWCHTVGYLSPLLAGVVLAGQLRGSRSDAAAIHSLLDVATEPREAANVAAGLTGVDRIMVIGSGADAVTARELALKISEGARLPAEALELETIHHGHLAAATRWTGLVLVLTDEVATAAVRERATRALDAAQPLAMPAAAILGPQVSASIDQAATPAGRMGVPRIGRVRGIAGSLLGAAIPLQLLAERLARARGVNPDTLGREDAAQAAAHA